MAASRKEYELLMKLTAALAPNFGSTFQTATSTTKKLQDSLQNLNKVQADISAYKKTQNALVANKTSVKELGARHTDLQQKLVTTSAKEKELQKALEKSAKATGTKTDEYKSLSAELKRTQSEKEKLTAQIKTNQAATEKATRQIAAEEQELADLSKRLNEAGINTDKLTKETEQLEKAYERVRNSQENIARVNQAIEENKTAISETKTELLKTVATVTATGAAFYKAFISPAAEFQSEMSNLGAITGATNEEIDLMASGMRAISKITGTPLMELAQNAKMVAEAGGDINLVMAQMSHGTNLANATQSDMATTLDFLGSQMKTFNLEAEVTKDVADSFAYVTSLANLELKQLGDAYVNVGGSAAQAGMSIDDVNAIMVTFSNAGLKGGAAGTSLNAVLRNLSTPTDKAAGALKELNVSLYDSTGASRDMFDIMKDLEKSLGGLTDKQRNHYQNMIFDTVAQKGWNMVSAEGIDTILELRDEITDSANAFDGLGQSAGMAGKQQNDLTGDILKAKAAWHDVSLTIGNLFTPYVRTAVQQVTQIINKVGEFAQENPELIKTLTKVVAGLAGLKIAGLGAKLGFQEIELGVNYAKKALALFQGSMAEGAAAAATGSGKIATLGKTLSSYFGGVKNSIGGVGSSVDALAGGKLSALGGTFSKIGGGMSDSILKPLSSIGSKVTGALGGVGGKVTGFFGGIGQKVVNGPLGKIGGVFQSLGSTAGAVLGGPLKGLGSLFGGLFGKAMPIIMILSALSMLFLHLSGEDTSAFIEPLKEAFEQLKPVLAEAMNQFKALGKQILPLLIGAAKQLAPLLGQIVTAILPVIIELIQTIVPIIVELVQQLLPAIINIITTLAPLLTDIITAILPVVVQLLQMLLPIITQLVTSILPLIVDVLNMLMPIITELIQAVLPVLMSILEALMPVIKFLAELLSNVLGAAFDGLKPIIEAVMGYFKGLIDFITGVFTGDWGKAWQGVKDMFSNIVSGLVGVFKLPINIIIEGVNTFLGGLNKLTIPDWVPGVGGKGINIPLIPKLETGSNYTPDTFIAGDVNGKGGELVTGARGRKVFTAAETSSIFENIKAANAMNSAPRAMPTAIPISGGGGQSFTIQYSPTIYVDGNTPGDLEEKLKQNNESLLQLLKDFLRQQRENERRMEFA